MSLTEIPLALRVCVCALGCCVPIDILLGYLQGVLKNILQAFPLKAGSLLLLKLIHLCGSTIYEKSTILYLLLCGMTYEEG